METARPLPAILVEVVVFGVRGLEYPLRERLEYDGINSQTMREIADVQIESITIEKTGTLKIKLINGNRVTEEELEKWN